MAEEGESSKAQNIAAGIGAAGNILDSISGPSYTKGAARASQIGNTIVSIAPATGPLAPFVAAAGFLISPLTKLAQGPQAYDTLTGEIKKNFGVSISKEDVINYYYNLGFETEGSKSAYRFTVQIVLSPMMLYYLYTVDGENFLRNLKANKTYNYGQDWEIPLREYIQTGNPDRLNNLYIDIFSEKVPLFFNLNTALIPVQSSNVVESEITKTFSSIPKEVYIIAGVALLAMILTKD